MFNKYFNSKQKTNQATKNENIMLIIQLVHAIIKSKYGDSQKTIYGYKN